jgi:hypothetical protein
MSRAIYRCKNMFFNASGRGEVERDPLLLENVSPGHVLLM